MRLLSGILIGILLTVGTAYIVDAMHTAPGADDKTPQHMVNWGVVSANLSGLSSGIQSGWSHLVGGVKEIDKNIQKSGN